MIASNRKEFVDENYPADQHRGDKRDYCLMVPGGGTDARDPDSARCFFKCLRKL